MKKYGLREHLFIQTQISFPFDCFQENVLVWYMKTSHFRWLYGQVYTQLLACHADILWAQGWMWKIESELSKYFIRLIITYNQIIVWLWIVAKCYMHTECQYRNHESWYNNNGKANHNETTTKYNNAKFIDKIHGICCILNRGNSFKTYCIVFSATVTNYVLCNFTIINQCFFKTFLLVCSTQKRESVFHS